MRVLRRLLLVAAVVFGCVVLGLLAIHRDSAVSTEIWIDAPPRQVWQVLTATAEYPAWNPMISRLTGDLREGNVIAFVEGTGANGMTFHPTILRVRPEEELRWKGHVLFPGIFDGEHRFLLQAEGPRTHLVQSEQFSGLLVGALTAGILKGTVDQMKAMNLALKQRCEHMS